MSVIEGVEHDLAALPEGLRKSGFAALALAMAERIDGGKGSPSECGKVLSEQLSKLRELAPPEAKKGAVDDLNERRARRLAGVSAAKD